MSRTRGSSSRAAGCGSTSIPPGLDAEVADLKSRGVTFEDYDYPTLKTVDGIAEIEGFRGAWFKDTEGNVLAVTEETGA